MTRFHKTAEYTAKDETRQVALGGLWVPDRVDTQGDYIRAGPLRDAAEDYMRRLQRGEAGQNIMHAVDGGDKLSLVENRILESADTVGGTEFPAGSWVPGVKAHDDDLWQLFEDNVFSGFSIGGEIINATEMVVEDVPDDVHIPDGYDADTVTRIDEARIDEFSPVDEPAVPMARVEVLKDMGKNSAELADPETCHAALVARGHDEETAARICEVMHKSAADTDDPKGEASARMTDEQSAKQAAEDSEFESSGTTFETTDDATLGRRFRRFLFGKSNADDESADESDASADAAKAGQVLSRRNVNDIKAMCDHGERVLERAGVDASTTRTYSDDPKDQFTLDGHYDDKAADGDVVDNETMTDNTESKSLAKKNSERLDSIESKLDKAIDAESEEPAEAEKSDDAEAPEWAKSLVDTVETLEERVDTMSKASADTQQAEGSEKADETTEKEAFLKGLVGGN